MLSQIHIRNFAIIDEVLLEFNSGMTVLTGETGAGKSILLDALGLTLGDRADSDMVRHGSERAEINVEFDLADAPEARSWLSEHEMDDGDLCLLRRTVNVDGRSKGYINGRPATLNIMKELGELLVDLHGQHEHQSLLKRDIQMLLLDEYAQCTTQLQQVAQTYQEWHQLDEKLQQLSQASDDKSARLELLRFQVNELDTLALQEGEFAALEEEHKRLANASQLIQGCEQALTLLYEQDESNVSSMLGKLSQQLDGLSQIDSALAPIVEMVDSAHIQAKEAASELRHHLSQLELDPERLNEVDSRLSSVHELSRKHHIDAEALHTLLPRLQEELDNIEHADVRLDELQAQRDQAARDYLQAASQLTQARQQAAQSLQEAVSLNMQHLGMQGGVFAIELSPHTDDHFSAKGMESIEFLVSANKGQPPKALSKVASGGELSRISLAIQVITAQNTSIPTLIFDEVDVGIGGGIAEVVGRQLRSLGQHAQVLCVTHQPQVAALAHAHLVVSKDNHQEKVQTRIENLKPSERIVEVARMLGGLEITSQTLSHAKEMVERAQDF